MAAKKSDKAKKSTSASKKKATKKEDLVDEIPEELAQEIEDAVSMEDEPSKQVRSTQIQITHYEDEKTDESVTVGNADDEDEGEEPEPAEDPADFAEDPVIEDEIEDDSTEESTDEEQDDHEWHKLEDDAQEETEDESALEIEVEEDEEIDRPEWDQEQYMQAESETAEEVEEERPEWDEEKWRTANFDEEEGEGERPDWDDEQYMQAESTAEEESDEEDSKDASLVAAAATVTEEADEKTEDGVPVDDEEEKTEAVVEAETDEKKEETPAVEANVEDSETDEEDPDQLSASQVALNADEDSEKKKFSLKALPKQIVAWWNQAKLRNSIITGMAAATLLIVTVPTPRYAVLNTVGVRATASVAVLDSETQLPLRDVGVSLSGQDVRTNQNGLATFDDVRLGTQEMTITKSAYDTYTQVVTIGVGANQIETVELIAVGTAFDFRVVDWLTSEPILDAEVSFGRNSAFVNAEGVAKLNTEEASGESIAVMVSAPGYAEATVDVDTMSTEQNEVALVLARKHLFISKRDGTYDVYKSLADGSQEELVLAGTGNERDDLRFDTSPSGDHSVLVATRDNSMQNADGFVLSGLYLIDTETNEFEMLDSSERIDLVGWIGDSLIYVKIQAGASGRNPERHRLVGLNTQTGELSEIAASNFFNDVIVAKDFVFFAPSDAYKQNPRPYLFRSNADGSVVETVFEKTVWTVLRTSYDDIVFDSEQVWYEGKIDRIFNVEADSRPTNFTSRLYTESPTGQQAAWVDIRDGKGSLIVVNTATNGETTITSQSGLRNPVVWLSDSHLIYRVVTSEETADYILNINGGEAVKITDVTDISGTDRWYYFY